MFYTLETQGRESLRLPLLPTSLQFSAHHLALLFSKLEAYSVLQYMYLWIHVAWNT